MIKKLIIKIKQKKFEKKCPTVRCTCCNYHYFNEDNHGVCRLKEELKLPQLYGRLTINN